MRSDPDSQQAHGIEFRGSPTEFRKDEWIDYEVVGCGHRGDDLLYRPDRLGHESAERLAAMVSGRESG
jgi:hypothetical protein